MEALIYLGKSMAILAIFYLVYFVFFRNEKHFVARRYYFLIGLLTSVLLPFLQFSTTIYIETPSFVETDTALAQVVLQEDMMVNSVVQTYDYWMIAASIYGIGLLTFGMRFILQLVSLRKILMGNSKVKEGRYIMVQTTGNNSPFSFLNYIVYNPNQHSEEEFAMILKHEKIHVDQRHSLDIIAANIICAIQWINPIAWIYKKRIEENLEFIADHETISQVESKKLYQHTLIRNAFPLKTRALTTQFYQSFIKRRIVMMNQEVSKDRNVWKLLFIAPLLSVFIWSCNVNEEVEYLFPESEIGKMVESFVLGPTTTDKELKLLESYFHLDNLDVSIKIKNLTRDQNGLIIGYDFMTKFEGEDEYSMRMTGGSEETKPITELLIEYSGGNINVFDLQPSSIRISIAKDAVYIHDIDESDKGELD